MVEAIQDYSSRISKYFEVEWKLLPSSDRGDLISIKKQEGEFILKNIDEKDFVIALDGKGKEFSTEDLALFLEKRMMAGHKRLLFIIGGAFGLSDDILNRADTIWSLSKLTFPHQLVRLILAESVYRALSVIKKEPYHHDNKK